ncbi:MAG: prephenate dehydrogenase [Sphingomonadaceae bacterium]|nr:prephenate dehydrogenase [Sphingomonadaceae bacterium]
MHRNMDRNATFKSIGLVGAGLIGGSLAAALDRLLPETALRVYDISPGNAAYVAERHRRGDVVGALGALARCDIVFVATPVAAIGGQVIELLRLGGEAIVIDTGSAKAAIVAAVAESGVDAGRFVPGHPLAGGVSTGPGLATPDNLTGRPFVLTPTDATAPDAVKRARGLLETLGVSVIEMAPDVHDRLLALGSHLPHLIAFALAGMAEEGDFELLPASFRGVAAFAASDPQMWSDIFRANSEELRAVADLFKKRLDLIAAMADEPAPGALLESLRDARSRTNALGESL